MKKMELEVKILEVDKRVIEEKLKANHVKKIQEIEEKMYVYDLYGLNSRYEDILRHINFYHTRLEHMSVEDQKLKRMYNEKDQNKLQTALERLKEFFIELDYLKSKEDMEFLKKEYQVANFVDIIQKQNYLEILNEKKFQKHMQYYFLNPHKWLRLRKSNDDIELTIKHIIPSNEKIEQIEEIEIQVNDFEETNELLEALGFQHKNYFEKKRTKYNFLDCEIDIDTWPNIPTYLEIEGESEAKIKEVLKILGYTLEQSISCTADQVFKKYGKSMFMERDLKFEIEK